MRPRKEHRHEGGGRAAESSHEDVLLSRLYQQITEMQQPRFAPEYDLEAGLERYRAWLSAQTTDPGTPDETGAGEN